MSGSTLCRDNVVVRQRPMTTFTIHAVMRRTKQRSRKKQQGFRTQRRPRNDWQQGAQDRRGAWNINVNHKGWLTFFTKSYRICLNLMYIDDSDTGTRKGDLFSLLCLTRLDFELLLAARLLPYKPAVRCQESRAEHFLDSRRVAPETVKRRRGDCITAVRAGAQQDLGNEWKCATRGKLSLRSPSYHLSPHQPHNYQSIKQASVRSLCIVMLWSISTSRYLSSRRVL